MAGILYIVATPIGNLDDTTYRALNTLKKVDIILCEDTRATKKLLNQFGIETKTMSYHQHSEEIRKKEIRNLLEEGKNIALATDAGTPGISDPGNELIEQLTMNNEQLTIVPIPGPSAVTAALSVCGFPADKFLFLGFPPHKKRRKELWQTVAGSPYTVVFYEAPYRIKKSIGQLAALIPDREICLCRELTKMHESIYRGTVKEISEMNVPEKGEFVAVVRASHKSKVLES